MDKIELQARAYAAKRYDFMSNRKEFDSCVETFIDGYDAGYTEGYGCEAEIKEELPEYEGNFVKKI